MSDYIKRFIIEFIEQEDDSLGSAGAAVKTLNTLIEHLGTANFAVEGRFPLGVAAKAGKIRFVNMLSTIEGINLDAQNHKGRTAVMLANKHGHFDVADFLEELGADMTLRDNKGMTTEDYKNEYLANQQAA